MMDQRRFWKIIDTSRKGTKEEQFDSLEEQLRALPAEEVTSFGAHFLACVDHADRNDIYAAASLVEGYGLSDDAFTYFLEWLIAQGEKVFENALRSPDSLADEVKAGEVCQFEGFGYIAARVWAEKTGLNTDEMPGYIATKGKAPDGPAWKDDDDLQQRFPRLWARFLKQEG